MARSTGHFWAPGGAVEPELLLGCSVVLYKKSSSAEFEMPLISQIGAVEMGQVVCLDQQPVVFEQRQRRQRLYVSE